MCGFWAASFEHTSFAPTDPAPVRWLSQRRSAFPPSGARRRILDRCALCPQCAPRKASVSWSSCAVCFSRASTRRVTRQGATVPEISRFLLNTATGPAGFHFCFRERCAAFARAGRGRRDGFCEERQGQSRSSRACNSCGEGFAGSRMGLDADDQVKQDIGGLLVGGEVQDNAIDEARLGALARNGPSRRAVPKCE
jgi:hypothetical protein